jgi:transposase
MGLKIQKLTLSGDLWVMGWLKKLFFETGGVVPRPPQKVNRRAVSPAGELYLQALLAEEVDLTLDELCERYESAYGVRIGVTTMHNTLKRLGFTRKKRPSATRSATPRPPAASG